MKVVTYLGSLVQLCCGEGGTLQTNITGMCGECSQCLGHTEFAPAQGACAFPVYISQALGCSAQELSEVDPELRALPRYKPLRFRFSGTPQRHRLSWACVLCPSQVQAAQVTRCLVSAVSPRWGVGLITCPIPAAGFSGCLQAHLLRCAICLFWGADLWLQPSQWVSSVQDPRKAWLAPANLLAVWWRMPSLGLCLPLSSSGCHPPASLPPAADGPTCYQLALWYSLSPLFCEQARQCLRLGLFFFQKNLFILIRG